MQDEFIWSYPLYYVGISNADSYEPCLWSTPDGDRALAVFTEKLHAERFRDVNWTDANVNVIRSEPELAAHAAQVRDYCEATYVTFDPFPGERKAICIPISEIVEGS